ncbi:hypothetical protein [Streptomyces umbrinus]|uniref:hypothetical protein n=1 Tax=Streptomyces umbrinus TaxID=67370 RepID=UPI0033D79165
MVSESSSSARLTPSEGLRHLFEMGSADAALEERQGLVDMIVACLDVRGGFKSDRQPLILERTLSLVAEEARQKAVVEAASRRRARENPSCRITACAELLEVRDDEALERVLSDVCKKKDKVPEGGSLEEKLESLARRSLSFSKDKKISRKRILETRASLWVGAVSYKTGERLHTKEGIFDVFERAIRSYLTEDADNSAVTEQRNKNREELRQLAVTSTTPRTFAAQGGDLEDSAINSENGSYTSVEPPPTRSLEDELSSAATQDSQPTTSAPRGDSRLESRKPLWHRRTFWAVLGIAGGGIIAIIGNLVGTAWITPNDSPRDDQAQPFESQREDPSCLANSPLVGRSTPGVGGHLLSKTPKGSCEDIYTDLSAEPLRNAQEYEYEVPSHAAALCATIGVTDAPTGTMVQFSVSDESDAGNSYMLSSDETKDVSFPVSENARVKLKITVKRAASDATGYAVWASPIFCP